MSSRRRTYNQLSGGTPVGWLALRNEDTYEGYRVTSLYVYPLEFIGRTPRHVLSTTYGVGNDIRFTDLAIYADYVFIQKYQRDGYYDYYDTLTIKLSDVPEWDGFDTISSENVNENRLILPYGSTKDGNLIYSNVQYDGGIDMRKLKLTKHKFDASDNLSDSYTISPGVSASLGPGSNSPDYFSAGKNVSQYVESYGVNLINCGSEQLIYDNNPTVAMTGGYGYSFWYDSQLDITYYMYDTNDIGYYYSKGIDINGGTFTELLNKGDHEHMIYLTGDENNSALVTEDYTDGKYSYKVYKLDKSRYTLKVTITTSNPYITLQGGYLLVSDKTKTEVYNFDSGKFLCTLDTVCLKLMKK